MEKVKAFNYMVSIIVPVYNSESTIDRCVRSIADQDYSDLQIILVNDGSTDKSLEKCLSWKYKDSRILVVDKENGGVSSARNKGLDFVTGEYVGFVDADDMIMPTFVSKLLSMIKEGNADMAICKSKKKETDETGISDTVFYNDKETLNNILYGKISTGVCGLLVKSQIIKSNGLRFAEGYKYSEDLHMVWRLAHYSKVTAFSKERHYVYFETGGSAMATFNKARRDSLKLFDDLYAFFLKNRPDFAKKFVKYGVAKNYWSYAWQAACKLERGKYVEEIKELRIRKYFVRLITYPKATVSLSSLAGVISVLLFRRIAIMFGKKYLH